MVMVIMLVLLNRLTQFQLSVVLTIRYINENVFRANPSSRI